MSHFDLVIKLGDSTTCIYKKGNGLVLKEASVIAFSKRGKKIVVNEVGNNAKELIGKTSNDVWVESPLKNDMIVNMELASLMLKRFLNFAYQDKWVNGKQKAVFVIDCSLSSEERKNYEILAMNCGIYSCIFLPSVVASLCYENVDLGDVKGNMIVDIGQDNTEIAVISKGSIINGYSMQLGGKVLDDVISNVIFEMFNIVISTNTAEKIKKQIASLNNTDISNMEFVGFDALTRASKSNTVFAKDLYSVTKVFYDKIISGIEIVLNQLSPDFKNDICENGVYICGGGSQATDLEHYFKRSLNVPINLIDDPDISSVLGVGKILDDMEKIKNISNNN